MLPATTGIRLGEALALQWRDLDLGDQIVIVRRQAQRRRRQGMVLAGVKTTVSRRVVPLVAGTISILERLRQEQEERARSIGMPWNDERQVFSTIDGGLVDPGTADKAFRHVLEHAGLPNLRVYDLRHTFSSFIKSRGRTDREAQEVLGHASPITTRQIYMHVMPDRRRAACTHGHVQHK